MARVGHVGNRPWAEDPGVRRLLAVAVAATAMLSGLAVAGAQTLPELPGVPLTTDTSTLDDAVSTVTVPPLTTVTTLPPLTVPDTSLDVPSLPTVPVTVPSLPGDTTVTATDGDGGLLGCTAFLTQQAAQLRLDADPRLASVLDPDGDGTACPSLPSGPLTTVTGGGAGASGQAPALAGTPDGRESARSDSAGGSQGARGRAAVTAVAGGRLPAQSAASSIVLERDDERSPVQNSLSLVALALLVALTAAVGGAFRTVAAGRRY